MFESQPIDYPNEGYIDEEACESCTI